MRDAVPTYLGLHPKTPESGMQNATPLWQHEHTKNVSGGAWDVLARRSNGVTNAEPRGNGRSVKHQSSIN